MPCDSVATVRATIQLPLEQFAAFPGALEALASLLADRRIGQIAQSPGRIELVVDGFEVQITAGGTVRCSAWSLAEQVKAAFEQAQSAVLVELARQKISQATRVTQEQQIGEQLVLTVEL